MLRTISSIISILLFIVGCSTTHLISSDDNFIAPTLIYKPIFIYPHTAQENKLTGEVCLILKIDKDGKVKSVTIDKSSGYHILDKSATTFAKQFKYKPAKLNGQPVEFYIKQSIDYDLVDGNSLTQYYIKQVKKLKKKIEEASPENQLKLQKELLVVYEDFINSNTDYIGFNQYIKEVINKDTYNKWDESVNDWPLHFLLFDDFQKSYKNSTINEDARNLMFVYLKKDFDTVEMASNMDINLLQKKQIFNNKISVFLNEEYANVLPDSLNYLMQ